MKKIKIFYLNNKDTIDTWFYWTSLLVLATVPYWIYTGGDYWIWGKENISLVFISLAGVCKAVMDTLQFHFDESIFWSTSDELAQFYDPDLSWRNKYIDGLEERGRKKFLKFIPVPVFLTDAWHLYQSFQINFICLAVVTYNPAHNTVIDFITYSFLYRAFFFLFYKYFLVKKW